MHSFKTLRMGQASLEKLIWMLWYFLHVAIFSIYQSIIYFHTLFIKNKLTLCLYVTYIFLQKMSPSTLPQIGFCLLIRCSYIVPLCQRSFVQSLYLLQDFVNYITLFSQIALRFVDNFIIPNCFLIILFSYSIFCIIYTCNLLCYFP